MFSAGLPASLEKESSFIKMLGNDEGISTILSITVDTNTTIEDTKIILLNYC